MVPIIVFAFNRPNVLKDLIDSLLINPEAVDSDLFVFVDGPRNDNDVMMVDLVRAYVDQIQGFKNVYRTYSDVNKGLGNSIISGVSEVIEKYGSVIVLEDDLVVTDNYLKFMNDALNHYKDENSVFSICGCSFKISIPKGYRYDTYFSTRNNSTGWGTWKDRWVSVDWELNDWPSCKKSARAFNLWAGSDCFSMLDNWRKGRNKSWAIRFCYSQFLQSKLSVFPVTSKVDNQGFDGSGTNSRRYNRYRYDIDTSHKSIFAFVDKVEVNRYIQKQIMRYHSLPLRLWSRIMYFIKG